MKKTITYIFLLSVTVLLLLNPDKSVYYAKKGIDICCDIIIPSLFPFFVCSGLLIYSGFCEVLAKLFRPVMKPLFNINPAGAAAFILGIVSGYPLGAVTACQLYNSLYLSKSEAERLLAFCNNSGPLFILGAVGVSLYHSPKIGIILYTAHILGAVTVGILFRFYKPSSFCAPHAEVSTNSKSLSCIFSEVLSNSIQSILTVCGAVIFCSVISSLIVDLININPAAKAILSGIMEFASGLNRISALDASLFGKLVISAWICAFAGVSVHLQVMGVTAKSGLSLKPYIIGKIMHGFFACVYTYIALKLIHVTQTTSAYYQSTQKLSAGFCIGSLYVLITVLFLFAMGIPYFFKRCKDKTKIYE
ncbi:MAG: hypothetical protein SOZ34_06215 [Clostridia bacterium]|nr:hypothetical protein [Clostridia bacterium]